MADEPTLRRGDQSADGWVEYLQTQLKAKTDLHLPTLVEVTGKFDEVTHWAVVELQVFEGLQSTNGVVGNETWAALLGDPDVRAARPRRDGRRARRPRACTCGSRPNPGTRTRRTGSPTPCSPSGRPSRPRVRSRCCSTSGPAGRRVPAATTNDAGQDRQYRFTFYRRDEAPPARRVQRHRPADPRLAGARHGRVSSSTPAASSSSTCRT